MKRILCCLLTALLLISFTASSFAAGYTLPYKMQRQLEVGSGLKGSFVIHSNASAEKEPLIHALSNVEFEIRGIRSEDNIHYYIYQPGENEDRNNLTEFSILENKYYLRSDFLAGKPFQLPDIDTFINSRLKAEGENPSIFPDILRMVLSELKGEEDALNTEAFEKQIEVWISSFKSDITIQSNESGAPRLTQEFRIPVETMYSAAAEMVRSVYENETTMNMLRAMLSQEQIDLYLNPDLGYYYLDAMKHLDMSGEIVFTKEVSTLGEMIHSSLTLPLEDSRTGFSSVRFESNELRKTILLTGSRGTYYLDLPVHFDLNEDSYEEEIRFARIEKKNPDWKNLALKIQVVKTYDKYDDEEESKTHEEVHYNIRFVKDTAGLPELIQEDEIQDMPEVNATLDLHYSSKLQLSSPTTLEISCNVTQGEYVFSLAGKIKTASQWLFAPFDVTEVMDAVRYSFEDFLKLKDQWVEGADEKLVRTPEEIKLTETTATAEPAEIPETADSTETEATPEPAEIPEADT